MYCVHLMTAAGRVQSEKSRDTDVSRLFRA